MKVRDVIALVLKDGWYFVRMNGSHRIYHHAQKAGIVVINGQPGKDMATGTYKAILSQAGLK